MFWNTCFTLFFSLSVAVRGVVSLPQTTPESNDEREVVNRILSLLGTKEIPEVVPSPNLPSLESLNITSLDLFKRALARFDSERAEAATQAESNPDLTRRYTPTCDGNGLNPYYAYVCYYYLWDLDSTPCVVPPFGSRFCHTTHGSGDVAWWGSTNGIGWDTTQSTCREVAAGGAWVLQNCQFPSWPGLTYFTGGTNAAWGNENLIVRIGSYN
ncbi:hypothetical protein CC1G_15748 [Coprinopsis cinerea okayama7|uniref:Secreted protein n=1 Tax=Coprinopsis cinerea (strain Okayama-7 / 130 / ATCC MYA-4618 / FGSC 9003) TaxID=240176 RepID=D6RQJ5_COPC7|nr:hypothetical protein CC1G_15748 [Coprinopsis cinerea okayama7\|eukprot:XP_002910319.1 hypothetical protein CC1G_15748 [Coprinopsis cinerea okayama7\